MKLIMNTILFAIAVLGMPFYLAAMGPKKRIIEEPKANLSTSHVSAESEDETTVYPAQLTIDEDTISYPAHMEIDEDETISYPAYEATDDETQIYTQKELEDIRNK